MKKIAFLAAMVLLLAVLPASAAEVWPKSDLWPRLVVWQEKTVLYADPGLMKKLKFAKDEEFRGALEGDELVVALEKSADGKSWKIDHFGDGTMGWVPAGPCQEVLLACSTGDNVNVRRAPVNGKADKRLQLFRNDQVATTGCREVPGSGRWYRVFMLTGNEAWVSGSVLRFCALPADESAKLYRQFKMAEAETDGRMESFGGVKTGDEAAALGPALKALGDGGYVGPGELSEGDNIFSFCLRVGEPVGNRQINIKVKNGKVAEILLDMRG